MERGLCKEATGSIEMWKVRAFKPRLEQQHCVCGDRKGHIGLIKLSTRDRYSGATIDVFYIYAKSNVRYVLLSLYRTDGLDE